jgi:hypothetical protein
MTPHEEQQCADGVQGMLMGLRGSSHKDLYADAEILHRDEIVASTGAGLFWRGGNPIYYTAKGSPEDLAKKIHSVLRSIRQDLAGHHVVFRLERDAQQSGHPYMRVHKLPLMSHQESLLEASDRGSEDPVEMLYQASENSKLPSSGNSGWLYNLPGTMRAEQVKLDVLYPLSQSSSSSGNPLWSCPLLRVSFWSQVVQGFSPLVPSPIRAARLFEGMTHSTRSHPTQEFSSLFSRLGNVHTSNGFCYCLDPEDCRVPHRFPSGGEPCTLLDTIRSLYDQQFRTAKVLTTAASVCKEQLDWPFEAGTMRDKSVNPGRNNASQECNVLDRLPLFQYRYMPVGRVQAPLDQRTSVDEGGSCHMGRSVQLESTFTTQASSMCKCRVKTQCR